MEQKQISFREFLDRNINLLTIIGIFNALAIYASSIQKDDIITVSISIVFLLLSIAATFPIIFDNSLENNFTNLFFRGSLGLCQLLIAISIVNLYLPAILWVVIPAMLVLSVISLYIYLFPRYIEKIQKFNIIIQLSIILGTFGISLTFVLILSNMICNLFNKYYFGH